MNMLSEPMVSEESATDYTRIGAAPRPRLEIGHLLLGHVPVGAGLVVAHGTHQDAVAQGEGTDAARGKRDVSKIAVASPPRLLTTYPLTMQQ